MSRTIAQLGGLTFDTAASGFPQYKLQQVAGWTDSPPFRTEQTPRPIQDGDFKPGRTVRGGKTMAVEGICIAGSQAAALAAYDELVNLSPDGQDMTLEVTDDLGYRTMTVRIAGIVQVTPFVERKARFNIPLYAYDPRKLSVLRQTVVQIGGGVTTGGLTYPLGTGAAPANLLNYGAMTPPQLLTVTNAGKAPSFPKFTVDGDMPDGFEIADVTTGERIRYAALLYAGQPVTYDTRTRRALTSDTNDVTDKLTWVDDLSFDGAQSRTFVFRPLGSYSGNPTLTVSMKDAWY